MKMENQNGNRNPEMKGEVVKDIVVNNENANGGNNGNLMKVLRTVGCAVAILGVCVGAFFGINALIGGKDGATD